jgi:hypothetical protein
LILKVRHGYRPIYPIRSASSGSMPVARRAGM